MIGWQRVSPPTLSQPIEQEQFAQDLAERQPQRGRNAPRRTDKRGWNCDKMSASTVRPWVAPRHDESPLAGRKVAVDVIAAPSVPPAVDVCPDRPEPVRIDHPYHRCVVRMRDPVRHGRMPAGSRIPGLREGDSEADLKHTEADRRGRGRAPPCNSPPTREKRRR